jgi:hypothetical protein
MTSEERRLLSEFLDQLKQAKVASKDPEAESLIAAAVARQPDAAYLLVQKALLQEQALNAAKAQIAQLQRQLEQAESRAAPSRGGLLGQDPWATAARPAPATPSPWPAVQPAGPSALGSFLGTAAATAAGIAGGAFLFQGLESLLGHHDHGGSFLSSTGTAPDPVENITINEYYGADDNLPEQDFQNADFDPLDAGFDGFDGYDDEDDGSLSV